ncbi:MAG: hypothetical protein MHPSP_002039, partial [Paramarteilia canceri]
KKNNYQLFINPLIFYDEKDLPELQKRKISIINKLQNLVTFAKSIKEDDITAIGSSYIAAELTELHFEQCYNVSWSDVVIDALDITLYEKTEGYKQLIIEIEKESAWIKYILHNENRKNPKRILSLIQYIFKVLKYLLLMGNFFSMISITMALTELIAEDTRLSRKLSRYQKKLDFFKDFLYANNNYGNYNNYIVQLKGDLSVVPFYVFTKHSLSKMSTHLRQKNAMEVDIVNVEHLNVYSDLVMDLVNFKFHSPESMPMAAHHYVNERIPILCDSDVSSQYALASKTGSTENSNDNVSSSNEMSTMGYSTFKSEEINDMNLIDLTGLNHVLGDDQKSLSNTTTSKSGHSDVSATTASSPSQLTGFNFLKKTLTRSSTKKKT